MLIDGFPSLSVNEAIGLAFIIELFGYSSSVAAYWKRHQIDFNIAKNVLMVTIPAAIGFRFVSFVIEAEILLSVFAFILLSLAVIIYRLRNSHSAGVGSDFRPRSCLFCVLKDKDQKGSKFTILHFQRLDRLALSTGGVVAGLIGIGIGEISNTYLMLKKKVPVRISTGTSALILHLTILSALIANFSIIGGLVPFLQVDNFQIPLNVAVIIAPTVLVGGQIGAFINSRLDPAIMMRILMTVYSFVGILILAILVLA